MLQNLSFSGHKINYEHHNFGLDKSLAENVNVEFGNIYTCHNLTYDTIKKHFPDFKIHKIWTENLDQCLLRFYDVFWKNEIDDTVESAFETISGIRKYYENNIPDKHCDVLIDIDNDNTNFCKIIRKELYSHQNPNFDQALKIFKDWGHHAPVNDIVQGKDKEIINESYRLNLIENE